MDGRISDKKAFRIGSGKAKYKINAEYLMRNIRLDYFARADDIAILSAYLEIMNKRLEVLLSDRKIDWTTNII